MSRCRAIAAITFIVVFVAATGVASYWLAVAARHPDTHPALSILACAIFGYCFGETISRRIFIPLVGRIFSDRPRPGAATPPVPPTYDGVPPWLNAPAFDSAADEERDHA